MHVSWCQKMNGIRRPRPWHWLVLQDCVCAATPALVRCPWARHSPQRFSCKPTIHIPSLPVSHQLSNSHTHARPHTHVCTHGDRLELKLQDSPRRNLHDWTSVEAEIQIVDQSGSVSLRSPHHHLIRRPPMSLKFPVCLVAPCKECHQHCTGFVDHIRYDHVLPTPPPVPHFLN